MSDTIDITSISPDMLATLLSNAFRQKITEEQVRVIAESGNLIRDDNTINILQYAAFLIGDIS
ncbi:MAG: hypothetical protein LBH59_00600 [Planctomycetaceae bacterium]|jgi:hypothetical protein|nr:hypothetical protein [Planctomycetaceae bacterium]